MTNVPITRILWDALWLLLIFALLVFVFGAQHVASLGDAAASLARAWLPFGDHVVAYLAFAGDGMALHYVIGAALFFFAIGYLLNFYRSPRDISELSRKRWILDVLVVLVLTVCLYGIVNLAGPQPDLLTLATKIFETSSETLVALFAVSLIYLEFRLTQVNDQQIKRRNAQTARYWVFYNVLNRIAQDMAVLREIDGRISTFVRAKNNGLVCRLYVKSILRAYSQSWANDDVLNRALDFEFVLLGQTEKTRMLEYFEEYNKHEDLVNRIVSKLEDLTAKMALDANADPGTSLDVAEFAKIIKESVIDDIADLRGSLVSILEKAMVLMVVVDYSDPHHNFAPARLDALKEFGAKYRDKEFNFFDWPWAREPKLTDSDSDLPRGQAAVDRLEALVKELHTLNYISDTELRRMRQFRRGIDTSNRY